MSTAPVAVTAERLLSSSRYRHPGDVIRLISAGLLLACAFVASWVASRWLLGPAASVPDDLGPAGPVTTGLVQVACLAGAAVVVAATLRRRRFRLLAGLAAGAVVAAALAAGIFALLGGQRPAALTADLARGSWLAGAAFPAPALFASAAAVVVGVAPWLSRPWRRVAWLTLLLAGVVRVLAGTMLPMQLILALATGVTVGAAVLVTFGVPDRRIGPGEIAAALRRAGLPVTSVRPAEVETKGSGKFAAVVEAGRRLFIKALGSDQRDADLLYRAYRAVRLRNLGDTRPAASLFHAVERQALAGVMAERAGVSVPGVDRIVRAGDTALLVMEWVDGRSLDRLPADQVGDDLLAWSPARLALLFGGSALVTLAYVGGLAASVEAFGGGASIVKIGAAYMAASAVAAASPTPGGVGAIEALLTAGLISIGISSGAAVSAVLTYRLATYWLPVLPGWFSWRLLQRMDYV